MPEQDEPGNQSRRSFLRLIPISLFAGIFSSLGVAAFRFLRPRITYAANETWVDVASLSELRASGPVAKKITTNHISGWAVTQDQHQVYVLPGNRVFSAVCPHEGCEVSWDNSANRFSCPCHESYFGPDGGRLTGPARRGLDPLPSRVKDDKLQVQYEHFENNTPERIKRA